jgi:hypothetical protein
VYNNEFSTKDQQLGMQQYFYLIHIQYLGFRFHGWAKQPNVKMEI